MKISEVVGKKQIDLNVDIGEGLPYDRDLLRFASSANICCGVHAGSPELTEETVEMCRRERVRIGAHPGYPDRASIGRLPMREGQEREYLRSIFDQVRSFVRLYEPAYLKPHGGFYHDTAIVLPANWQYAMLTRETFNPYDVAGKFLAQYPGVHSLMTILRMYKLPLMGLEGTSHRPIADRAPQPLFREGFADRAYTDQGVLVPRSEPHAVLTNSDEIKAQVLRLAPSVDSICLHGDTEHCVEFAELIYQTLTDAGYGIGV